MGLKFVYPEFLFALSLLAIPVIIHLFNFRRYKKIFFTNVRFLKEVTEETTSRSKIKHWLVLLSRLLAVTFLVMAFSQPYLPKQLNTKISNNRAISIFVDNSYSMEANGREGTLLQEAKSKAIQVASAYQPSDQFQLLTCDFDPVHQRLVNKEEFISMLDQIKISSSVRSTSEIISRQHDALQQANANEKSSFLISDFQKSTTDLNQCKPDSFFLITLIPVKSEVKDNVFIDSCWFTSPLIQLNVPCNLNVRIKNASGSPVQNLPLKLYINGLQKSLTSIAIDANGSATSTLSFSITTPGWQQAELALTDFPVTFDDKYFFSFEVAGSMQVICINKAAESPYLKAMFGGNAFFDLKNQNISRLDYSLFSNGQLIILNELTVISSGLAEELKKFVLKGGSLVVFPDSVPDMSSYQTFLQNMQTDVYTTLNTTEDKVERIDTKSDLFSDVFEKVPENMDLPVVQKHFEISSTIQSKKEVLIKLATGAPLLSRYPSGKGKIYLFSVPLNSDFSGLPRHSLFVPVMYKIALLSRLTPALSYQIGGSSSINTGNIGLGGEDVFHLINENAKVDVIPQHRSDPGGTIIDIPDGLSQAGNYNLHFNEKVISVISLNYNRKESPLEANSLDELNKTIETARLINFNTIAPDKPDLTKSLLETNEGLRFWKWCIVFALLFLLVEILLLKFLK